MSKELQILAELESEAREYVNKTREIDYNYARRMINKAKFSCMIVNYYSETKYRIVRVSDHIISTINRVDCITDIDKYRSEELAEVNIDNSATAIYDRVVNLFYPPKIPFTISFDADILNYMPLLEIKDILTFSLLNKYCYKVAKGGLINKHNLLFSTMEKIKEKVIKNLTCVQLSNKQLRKTKSGLFVNSKSFDNDIEIIKHTSLDVLFDIALEFPQKFDSLINNIFFCKPLDRIYPKKYEQLLFPDTRSYETYKDFIEWVKKLDGVNLDVLDTDGYTPLWHALDKADVKTMQLLIDNGADIKYNVKGWCYEIHAYTKYRKEKTAKRLEVIKFLFKNERTLNTRWDTGDHFINEVIHDSDVDLLMLMLEYNTNVIVKNSADDTPFSIAYKSENKLLLTEILLKHCADRKIKLQFDDCIMLCIQDKEMLELYLKYDNDSKYCILNRLITAKELDVEMVHKLVKMIDSFDYLKQQKTPLQCAAGMGYLEICKLLLDKGANINEHNEYGSQAIHFAAQNGHYQICKYLIDKGSDIDEKGIHGLTPIMFAFGLYGGKLNFDIVNLLMEHGVETDIRKMSQHFIK